MDVSLHRCAQLLVRGGTLIYSSVSHSMHFC